jgi:DNA repair exonuclease SbcCD ATPase subunit
LKTFSIFQEHRGSYEIEKSWLLPNVGHRPFQVLSGSEKIILFIGLKIALSKLMPGADFFIMDNPLIHLDEHRREYMIDYVTRLSNYKQVIMLTNDHQFADQLSTANRFNI